MKSVAKNANKWKKHEKTTKNRLLWKHYKTLTFSGDSGVFKNTFSGKQTQFPESENHCNLLQWMYLQQFTPPNQQKKQTQNKPNSNPILEGDLRFYDSLCVEGFAGWWLVVILIKYYRVMNYLHWGQLDDCQQLDKCMIHNTREKVKKGYQDVMLMGRVNNATDVQSSWWSYA